MSGVGVLVVEDDVMVRDSLAHILENEDFKVATAESSEEGFPLLYLYHPDVILIDMILPELGGLEFIRWVKDKAEFKNIRIIAMSGYDKNYLVAAILAGADAALHKPEDIDKVVEVIQEAA